MKVHKERFLSLFSSPFDNSIEHFTLKHELQLYDSFESDVKIIKSKILNIVSTKKRSKLEPPDKITPASAAT